MQDPGFQQLCARRFQEFRAGPWSEASVAALIDAQQAALEPAALRTLNKCARVRKGSGHRS